MPCAAESPYPVAGLAPHARPEGAPRVTAFAPSQEWQGQALGGVSGPRAACLGFIGSQGAWYTPCTRPGMTGPYDLRGWHAHAKSGEAMPRESGK